MEVQLSRFFGERIRSVAPGSGICEVLAPVLVASAHGIVVEKTVVDSWARGTFRTPLDSFEYHFRKYGGGRTRQQYTFDALRFFNENRGIAQWGKWHPAWHEAFRLKVGSRRGYFTPGGRILSFWDEHEDCQTTL